LSETGFGRARNRPFKHSHAPSNPSRGMRSKLHPCPGWGYENPKITKSKSGYTQVKVRASCRSLQLQLELVPTPTLRWDGNPIPKLWIFKCSSTPTISRGRVGRTGNKLGAAAFHFLPPQPSFCAELSLFPHVDKALSGILLGGGKP
jgi:hypothetical protein